MNDGGLLILTTTFPDRSTAERVVALLVDGGLAVCGQVGADLRSFYRWEGELRDTAEVAVTLKVLPERYELCAGELKLQHPYEVPQIVAWPAARVEQSYLDWARGNGA